MGVGAMVTALAGCATMATYEQELTKTNTQTVLAFQETVFNKHEAQLAFDHYVGPTFTQHDPRLVDGRDEALAAYRGLARSFPTSQMTVRRTIAQGDLVAVQASWQSAPGAEVVAVFDLYRLNAGRIIEHWDVVQNLPLAQARGAAPL